MGAGAVTAPVAITGPRDVRDAKRLAALEVTIERGKTAFVEVGEALIEIRDSRLYRINHATFEAYCKSRWGFTHQRASQLMTAAAVVTALPESATTVANEAQARELAPVLAEHGPEAVAAVMAEASADGKPTAEKIRAAAAPFRPRIDPAPDPYYAERVKHTTTVTEEVRIETADPRLWSGLVSVMDAIEGLTASDAVHIAAAVPDRRRVATAKRLRKLGTFLGRIAWTLEGSEGSNNGHADTAGEAEALHGQDG